MKSRILITAAIVLTLPTLASAQDSNDSVIKESTQYAALEIQAPRILSERTPVVQAESKPERLFVLYDSRPPKQMPTTSNGFTPFVGSAALSWQPKRKTIKLFPADQFGNRHETLAPAHMLEFENSWQMQDEDRMVEVLRISHDLLK